MNFSCGVMYRSYSDKLNLFWMFEADAEKESNKQNDKLTVSKSYFLQTEQLKRVSLYVGCMLYPLVTDLTQHP